MKNRRLGVALGALAALALILAGYAIILLMTRTDDGQARIERQATGEMADFTFDHRGEPAPDLPFQTADGGDRTLADFAGRVVLVNLWATWCAPCLTELPHLAELDRALGGDRFTVVAVSLDRSGTDKAAETLAKVDAQALTLYVDPTMRFGRAFGESVMPVTVLVGPDGREIGRYLGPADWASDDAKALIRAAIDARV